MDYLARISARPESSLTDEKLVDVGFPADRADMIGIELATVHGPLSFQGELFFFLQIPMWRAALISGDIIFMEVTFLRANIANMTDQVVSFRE